MHWCLLSEVASHTRGHLWNAAECVGKVWVIATLVGRNHPSSLESLQADKFWSDLLCSEVWLPNYDVTQTASLPLSLGVGALPFKKSYSNVNIMKFYSCCQLWEWGKGNWGVHVEFKGFLKFPSLLSRDKVLCFELMSEVCYLRLFTLINDLFLKSIYILKH